MYEIVPKAVVSTGGAPNLGALSVLFRGDVINFLPDQVGQAVDYSRLSVIGTSSLEYGYRVLVNREVLGGGAMTDGGKLKQWNGTAWENVSVSSGDAIYVDAHKMYYVYESGTGTWCPVVRFMGTVDYVLSDVVDGDPDDGDRFAVQDSSTPYVFTFDGALDPQHWQRVPVPLFGVIYDLSASEYKMFTPDGWQVIESSSDFLQKPFASQPGLEGSALPFSVLVVNRTVADLTGIDTGALHGEVAGILASSASRPNQVAMNIDRNTAFTYLTGAWLFDAPRIGSLIYNAASGSFWVWDADEDEWIETSFQPDMGEETYPDSTSALFFHWHRTNEDRIILGEFSLDQWSEATHVTSSIRIRGLNALGTSLVSNGLVTISSDPRNLLSSAWTSVLMNIPVGSFPIELGVRVNLSDLPDDPYMEHGEGDALFGVYVEEIPISGGAGYSAVPGMALVGAVAPSYQGLGSGGTGTESRDFVFIESFLLSPSLTATYGQVFDIV